MNWDERGEDGNPNAVQQQWLTVLASLESRQLHGVNICHLMDTFIHKVC